MSAVDLLGVVPFAATVPPSSASPPVEDERPEPAAIESWDDVDRQLGAVGSIDGLRGLLDALGEAALDESDRPAWQDAVTDLVQAEGGAELYERVVKSGLPQLAAWPAAALRLAATLREAEESSDG